MASVTAGSFGHLRFFGMDSKKVGDGNLLIAVERGTYDGPWTTSDDMQKINSLFRYTQGTATDGLSITGMAYANQWTSTNRFAMSARIAGTDDAGSWKTNAYVVKSQLDLFNEPDDATNRNLLPIVCFQGQNNAIEFVLCGAPITLIAFSDEPEAPKSNPGGINWLS
jgi:hypothetical protein